MALDWGQIVAVGVLSLGIALVLRERYRQRRAVASAMVILAEQLGARPARWGVGTLRGEAHGRPVTVRLRVGWNASGSGARRRDSLPRVEIEMPARSASAVFALYPREPYPSMALLRRAWLRATLGRPLSVGAESLDAHFRFYGAPPLNGRAREALRRDRSLQAPAASTWQRWQLRVQRGRARWLEVIDLGERRYDAPLLAGRVRDRLRLLAVLAHGAEP